MTAAKIQTHDRCLSEQGGRWWRGNERAGWRSRTESTDSNNKKGGLSTEPVRA